MDMSSSYFHTTHLEFRLLMTVSFYKHTRLSSHQLSAYVYLQEYGFVSIYRVVFVRATVLSLGSNIAVTQLLIAV